LKTLLVLLRYGAVETTETGLNMATGVPSFAAANETAIVEFTSPTTKTSRSTELVLVVLAAVH